MTTGKPRSPPTPKALDIPPDEIITMMDNDWIPAIQSGESTILEIVLPFLDQEAKRVIAEKGRLSYAGQCAHDLRVNACDLRNAIESGNAEMSAALAMLVLARAIENGYGYGAMMLEATAAYRKRQAKAVQARHDDASDVRAAVLADFDANKGGFEGYSDASRELWVRHQAAHDCPWTSADSVRRFLMTQRKGAFSTKPGRRRKNASRRR